MFRGFQDASNVPEADLRYIGSALSSLNIGAQLGWMVRRPTGILRRATAKRRITAMFDHPETNLFQKSRAFAQYLPRIAM